MSRFICVRIIAFFSIMLAMVVVGVCGWTLANTLRFGEVVKQRIDLSQSEQVNVTDIPNYDNYTHHTMEDSGEMPNRPTTTVGGMTSSFHWTGMTRRYKLLIQTSVAVSIFASLVQLIMSTVLLGTRAKHMRLRTRFWQLTNFIVMLCLVMCVLVPLSYNRDKDTFRGTVSFGHYVKKELITFYRGIMDSGGGRSFGSHPSIAQFVLAGLNFYYIVIASNVLLLLIFIVFSFCSNHSGCCCCSCCWPKRNYRRSVY